MSPQRPRPSPVLLLALATFASAAYGAEAPIRPDHPEWPRVWLTYRPVKSFEGDLPVLRAAGVRCIGREPRDAAQAREILEVARRHGMKLTLSLSEVTEHAVAFHRRLAAEPPPKPEARLAVIRSYRSWALSSRMDGKIRNPADWMLQQLLEVWAVQHGRPYDVFEVPPECSLDDQKKLEASLEGYEHVVATEPREGAWVIGAGTNGTAVAPATSAQAQRQFEEDLRERGWLPDAGAAENSAD